VKPFTNLVSDKKSLGNVMARIRMVILYSMANKYNGLVAGTSTKAKFLLDILQNLVMVHQTSSPLEISIKLRSTSLQEN